MTVIETLVRRKTPEDRALEQKLVELSLLETELEHRELDLATLRAQLRRFDARYLKIVGSRYAELDEIEAQIAEMRHRKNPNDKEAEKRATEARREATESAQAASHADDQKEKGKFQPTERMRRLYREVAKRIHPDLAGDSEEQTRRHRLMAEANRAYEEGDEEQLEAILMEWIAARNRSRAMGRVLIWFV